MGSLGIYLALYSTVAELAQKPQDKVFPTLISHLFKQWGFSPWPLQPLAHCEYWLATTSVYSRSTGSSVSLWYMPSFLNLSLKGSGLSSGQGQVTKFYAGTKAWNWGLQEHAWCSPLLWLSWCSNRFLVLLKMLLCVNCYSIWGSYGGEMGTHYRIFQSSCSALSPIFFFT